MRVWASLVLMGLAGCGGKAVPSSAERFHPAELEEAVASYQAFCGLCPNAETCCMEPKDLEAAAWTSGAGAYLRAMRDFYQCQRLATLDHAQSSPRIPLLVPGAGEGRDPNTSVGPFSGTGNIRDSCFLHACGEYGDVMVAELDRARTNKEPHVEGALVVCPSNAVSSKAAR